MMGKIFSQAEEVIAWLGPGSDRIARLFDRVMSSSLCHEYESRSIDTSDSIYESAAHARSALRSASKPFDEVWGNDSYEDFRSDLLALAAAGYWYRSWIVQEVVLAREISILCGTAHVSNIGVVALFLIISRFLGTGRTDLKKMNRLSMVLLNRVRFQNERSYFERQDWTRLGHIIQHHNLSETHDPRDKIYAFVGMAQDSGQDFTVDYNKSLHQVTMEIIRDHIPYLERSVDAYFRMIVTLLGLERKQLQTITQQVDWTEDFYRTCQQTLLPYLLSNQLSVELWFVGRVSSAAGSRVTLDEIPDFVGLNVTAWDYTIACDHISGEPVKRRDLISKLHGTKLCCVYRLTGQILRFVATLIVVAHPGSGDSVAAVDWQRARSIYERSQVGESLGKSTVVREDIIDELRHRELTDDPSDTRNLGWLGIAASISVTDLLVVVEADFPDYLQHYYRHDLALQLDTLMFDSRYALAASAVSPSSK